METRKVQLSGGSTYTVSLPKEWAEEHGIEAGSQLFLHPRNGGSLHVSTNGKADGDAWERTLSVTHLSPAEVRERVTALYAIGTETLTLTDSTGIDDEIRSAVVETTDGLSGLELLGTEAKRLRIDNLVGPENVDVRKNTLRLRLVALAMHRDATTAVLEGDEDLASEVVGRDDEADKLFALLTRHFSRAVVSLREVRQLGYARRTLFEYYYVGRQLERVADHAERIARLVLETEADVTSALRDTVRDLADRAQQVVEDASEVLLGSASIEAADDVLGTRNDLLSEIEALDREMYAHDDTAEAYLIGRLLRSLRRTVEYGNNIAQILIQRSVRQPSG